MVAFSDATSLRVSVIFSRFLQVIAVGLKKLARSVTTVNDWGKVYR